MRTSPRLTRGITLLLAACLAGAAVAAEGKKPPAKAKAEKPRMVCEYVPARTGSNIKSKKCRPETASEQEERQSAKSGK